MPVQTFARQPSTKKPNTTDDQPYNEAAKDQVSIMELEAVILRVHIDQSGVAAIRLAAVVDRLKVEPSTGKRKSP